MKKYEKLEKFLKEANYSEEFIKQMKKEAEDMEKELNIDKCTKKLIDKILKN